MLPPKEQVFIITLVFLEGSISFADLLQVDTTIL